MKTVINKMKNIILLSKIKKAKKISLEKWLYLETHPNITTVFDLPKRLFNKIKKMKNFCPLCEIFSCDICILPKCSFESSLYWNWTFAKNENEHKVAAQNILKTIEAWEPQKLMEIV